MRALPFSSFTDRMVDTENVPQLLKQLCQSFVPVDRRFYITQSQRRKNEEKLTRQFKQKALDCILFDYDEEFSPENTETSLAGIKSNAVQGKYGADQSKKLLESLNCYLGKSRDASFRAS